ncbi:MAG: TetR/AcrR family transcriptional regulator [Rhodospirillaceae bacterium]|nr:TetR/AcrR family transcriptional regulator [Rhodospirillaceae bacterium]
MALSAETETVETETAGTGAAPKARRPRPLRRTQEERSAETRARLIEATIALIGAQGYANLTTPEIAAAAGVSRGALQHHFATRYELVAAVNDKLTGDMTALGEALGAGALPLAKRVDAVIDHYMSVYSSPTYRAILDISLGIREAPMRERVRRLVADIYRKSDAPWLDLFADTGLSRKELVTLRRLTLATLRGLALARILDVQQESVAPELAALKAGLVARLGGAR